MTDREIWKTCTNSLSWRGRSKRKTNYNKKFTGYTDSTSHAYVDSSCLDVDCHITHYTYESYTDWINKINFYSTQSAKTMHTNGVKRSSIRPITHSLFSFFKKSFEPCTS